MQENGTNMYKPNFCKITIVTPQGFDEKRNPIPGSSVERGDFPCFLDDNPPTEVIFSPDGQLVKDASGVIFLEKDFISKKKLALKVGSPIKVYNKKTKALILTASVKAFKEDLFHTRIWV